MQIRNKRQCNALAAKGMLGNQLRTWYGLEGLESFKNSGYHGTVSVRWAGGIAANNVYYNVNHVDLVCKALLQHYGSLDYIVINESAPDHRLTIQGEVMQTPYGLYLAYSTVKGKMRDCMINAKLAVGLQAKLLLEQYLDASSFGDIMDLLETYDNHIIEFSTYDCFLGNCNCRNTIIWEVRNY